MNLGSREASFACCLMLAGALAFSCGGESEDPDGGAGAGGGSERSCESIQTDYAEALAAAKVCTPNQAVDPCTESVTEGLACSCPTFANPENDAALARIAEEADAFARQGCGSGIVCGPCATPTGGHCSAAGHCEDVYGPEGIGCKVDGQYYADGEGGIPDPVSCNTCTCQAGALVCTEINCPMPCPAGTAYGIDCAECGPVDQCLVVEHACLTSCVDVCEGAAACVSGLCRYGLCG